MKLHRLSIYARTMLVIMSAGVVMACVPVRDAYESDGYPSPRAQYYDYWYYPAIGSYYDPRTRIYIYAEHDHWIRGPVLPARLQTGLGRHVIVHSPHARPYEAYRLHRQQYAPEQYRPERHKEPQPSARGSDRAPRERIQQRKRDDQPTPDNRGRPGNGSGHDTKGRSDPGLPRHRIPQPSDRRPENVPSHSPQPAGATPDGGRTHERNNGPAPDNTRDVAAPRQRRNDRHRDDDDPKSRSGRRGPVDNEEGHR